MNRRELFKGLTAALVAASIPVTVESLEAIPDAQMVAYLTRVRTNLLNKLINPPCIMHSDGQVEIMKDLLPVWQDALHHVNILLEEFK